MFCFSPVTSFLLQNLSLEEVQCSAVGLFQILIEFLFFCHAMTHRIGYESLHNLDCTMHSQIRLIVGNLHFEELYF